MVMVMVYAELDFCAQRHHSDLNLSSGLNCRGGGYLRWSTSLQAVNASAGRSSWLYLWGGVVVYSSVELAVWASKLLAVLGSGRSSDVDITKELVASCPRTSKRF